MGPGSSQAVADIAHAQLAHGSRGAEPGEFSQIGVHPLELEKVPLPFGAIGALGGQQETVK